MATTSKKYFIKEKYDPIFLPFDYEDHKQNKIELMKAELSVIKCLRILENLKMLQNKKSRLKKELQSALFTNIKNFEKTWNDMPKIENKDSRIKQTNTNFNEESEPIELDHSHDSLGKELMEIQEKLKKLSAYQQ